MIRVCSGFSPTGYEQYGKRFLETFHKHWPADVDLRVYTEAPVSVPRGQCVSLFACDGVKVFLDRHAKNKKAQGREPTQLWKDKERENGYTYRFDACKFCRQLFIPEHAARGMADGDTLVWLDADVISFAQVPVDLVERLLAGKDICYLGRGKKHSEIGFWAVRLNAGTRAFLSALADMYRKDKVFDLGQWHSAFVFDYVRKRSDCPQHDITPEGRGHVWFQSPLGACTDHLKGQRKKLGKSPERKAG